MNEFVWKLFGKFCDTSEGIALKNLEIERCLKQNTDKPE